MNTTSTSTSTLTSSTSSTSTLTSTLTSTTQARKKRRRYPIITIINNNLLVLFFLLVIEILFFSPNVSGQTCATTSNVNQLCQNAVNTYRPSSFFLFPNTSKAQVINSSAHQLEVSKLLPLSCREIFTAFACAGFYPPCFYIPLSPDLPWPSVIGLPRPPCRSLCLEVIEKCGSSFSPSQLPNCSSIDPSTHQPTFPQHSIIISVNGENITSFCFNYSDTLPRAPNPFLCPPPLVFAEDQDPHCVLFCPNQLIPTWVNTTRRIFLLSLGCIGQVFLLIVILTHLTRAKHRQYPTSTVSFMAISVFFLNLSNIIGAGSFPTSICYDSSHPKDYHDPLCLILGMIFIFFSINATCLWVCLAAHLALTMFFHLNEFQAAKFKWPLYLASLVIPLVVLIISLALGEIDNSGNSLLECFIAPTGSNDDIYIFFIIFTILLFVGIVCNGCIFCEILRNRIQLHRIRTSTISREVKDLKLILFILLYILAVGLPIALRFKVLALDSVTQSGLDYWIQCNIEHLVTETSDGQVNNPQQNELCQVMSHHFPSALMVVTWLVESFVGIAFGFFFLNRESFVWIHAIGLFLIGRGKFPTEATVLSKSLSKSNSGR